MKIKCNPVRNYFTSSLFIFQVFMYIELFELYYNNTYSSKQHPVGGLYS
jgi:hypothetical protein